MQEEEEEEEEEEERRHVAGWVEGGLAPKLPACLLESEPPQLSPDSRMPQHAWCGSIAVTDVEQMHDLTLPSHPPPRPFPFPIILVRHATNATQQFLRQGAGVYRHEESRASRWRVLPPYATCFQPSCRNLSPPLTLLPCLGPSVLTTMPWAALALAAAALKKLDGYELEGKAISVAYAKSKSHVVAKADGTYAGHKRRERPPPPTGKKAKMAVDSDDEAPPPAPGAPPPAPYSAPPPAGYPGGNAAPPGYGVSVRQPTALLFDRLTS